LRLQEEPADEVTLQTADVRRYAGCQPFTRQLSLVVSALTLDTAELLLMSDKNLSAP